MLRIHAWQSPYVCAACRQGFSIAELSRTRARRIETGTKLSNGRPLPCTTSLQSHSLFSTSARFNDGQKPAFPGGFDGAGKFGAFASKAKPTATPGLLPHELAARSKTVTEAPTPAPLSRQKPSRSIDPTRNEKTIKSKSILADIFQSGRQPRDPATPASWSSSSDRKANRGDADRKPGDSNIWQEITRNRRSAVKHVRAAAQKGKTANAASTTELSEFWNEMEDQASASRAQRDRDTREREVPKKMQGKYAGVHSHPSHVGDEPPRNQPEASTDKPRKSRFDEEVKSRDSKKSKRVKRQSAYNITDEEWEDDGDRWNELQERKKAKEARKRARSKEPDVIPIFLPEFISASNLAQALQQRVDSFMKDMEEMGFENITGDTIMTGETAALVAMEYGFEPTVDNGSQRDIQPAPVPDDVSSLPSRPPVVTIMGHVDHGKTTLLDYLRKSSVAAQEHGGITQHIGAFIVNLSSGKQITFLDTPGHAAFLTMRQRGANVTDIVVLVVAADDSVKPQTLEALKHARAAKVPIIVAINKIDKEDARVDQVKADLSRHGVEIEDYGGDVQVVCVSGKTGQGMPELEENIVTLSEILDVRAETDGMANGWLLESSVKQDGRAATVLVKRGTLRMGDHIVAGKTWARIRMLRNEAGVEISEAPPGTPVEILGWRELPAAGEMVLQAPDEAKAKTAVEYRLEMAEREQNSANVAEQEQRQREKAAAEVLAAERTELGEKPDEAPAEPGILTQNFIVKADVAGSVEAVSGSIMEQGNHEVQSKVLRSTAGQVTEYDVDLAAASRSIIVNFTSAIPPHIKQRADDAKVRIIDHTVIYHVVDEVRAVLGDLLPMLETQRVSGEADILQVFPINVTRRITRNIAGCRVRNGALKKGTRVKVLRKGRTIYDGIIDTIKHGKKDVQEMGKGTECGVGLEDFQDFQEDDQIQTYEIIKEKRQL